MSLQDRKITDWTQPVSSLADRPQMAASALKAAFDSNTNQIKPALNGVIDDLIGTGGAGNIGVQTIAGVTGTTVQAMLAALKALIDLCDTTEDSDEKFALKADKTTTDKLVKTITFDADTGVFTIKTDDGTTSTIDTLLEKVPINCYLDGQEFVLVLDDGTEQRVDLSAFLTTTEFTDSDTIDFGVSGSTVTASVKNGSITLQMLESTVMSTLQGYMSAAQTAASNAETSETNAGTYAGQAENAKTTAQTAASEADAHATESQSWAVGGTGTRAGEDTNNSKYFAQQAAGSSQSAHTYADNAMEQADKAELDARQASLAAESAATLASQAGKAQQSIQNMTVDAQTIGADEDATVQKITMPDGSIKLHFGIPQGARGIDGAAVSADGVFAFNVNADGDLILSYQGETAPNFSINEAGYLIYQF